MAKLLIYYAHPGQRHSYANRPMVRVANAVEGISFVDLYADYPRHNIDVDTEQSRLQEHDVILLQFPLFWYSVPSLLKDWLDLVLEHGFAYGAGGDKLRGKTMMLAITTGAPADAYSPQGYQRYPLRTFLTPLEQTAHLSKMRFPAPYVLHASLEAEEGDVPAHAAGYGRLLTAIRDDKFDFDHAEGMDILTHDTLPMIKGA